MAERPLVTWKLGFPLLGAGGQAGLFTVLAQASNRAATRELSRYLSRIAGPEAIQWVSCAETPHSPEGMSSNETSAGRFTGMLTEHPQPLLPRPCTYFCIHNLLCLFTEGDPQIV